MHALWCSRRWGVGCGLTQRSFAKQEGVAASESVLSRSCGRWTLSRSKGADVSFTRHRVCMKPLRPFGNLAAPMVKRIHVVTRATRAGVVLTKRSSRTTGLGGISLHIMYTIYSAESRVMIQIQITHSDTAPGGGAVIRLVLQITTLSQLATGQSIAIERSGKLCCGVKEGLRRCYRGRIAAQRGGHTTCYPGTEWHRRRK